MKGEKFLKVTGILMIIGGAISIIISIIAIAGIAATVAFAEALEVEVNSGLLYLSCILLVISAAAELVAGILGVANAKKPEKANVCLVFGIIVAVLSVLGNILTVAAGGSFDFFSLVIGLVLPVLYIIGAVLNKKPAAATPIEG